MRPIAAILLVCLAQPARADGPADNVPEKVRPVPKPGIAVPEVIRMNLEGGLSKLAERIAAIEAKKDPKLAAYLPDIRIYHKAVRDALTHNEFFEAREFNKAMSLIEEGQARASALLDRGEAPWTKATGLVVLGYVSKIDGSVQPYGLVVPPTWQPGSPHRHRLDIWFHGRGETLSEVNFLDEHRKQAGIFTPDDALVLHPYGRYCNAFKFAGEVDVLEALDDVKRRYRIDEDRIAERGFSMGGAAAWQFAVHYPDLWFAANPGAGFAETPQFLKVFQNEKVQPTAYEKTLWHLYDCTDWATNLLGLPTVAYSGELDNQKQAADVMAEALKPHGIELTHVIGPKTKHQYEPGAKAEVERKMSSLAALGRAKKADRVDFTTYTLRYPRMRWVVVEGMESHWKPARIRARFDDYSGGHGIISAENVSAFRLDFPAGTAPIPPGGKPSVEFEGDDPQTVAIPGPETDLSWRVSFHREGGRWTLGPAQGEGLRKTHGLQGPIDDAFMDAFVFVRPTGESKNEKVASWVRSESDRAVSRWRTQFRGDARIKDDTAVTDGDIASMNLVLWGDPESNSVLKKIADKLPIRWDGDRLVVADRTYPAADHVPILIFPNPLNPSRYVVLNSGFTYREYDDLNNARQVPKLPDWAIVDVNTPPNSRYPGKVVDADFFDESWRLKKR